jgi:hypothetical protein
MDYNATSYLELSFCDIKSSLEVVKKIGKGTKKLYIKINFDEKEFEGLGLSEILGEVHLIYTAVMNENLDNDTIILLPTSEDVLLTDNTIQIVYNINNLQEVNSLRQKKKLSTLIQKPITIAKTKPSPKKTFLSIPQYPVVVLGGTFDHLHAGHKYMLTAVILSVTKKSHNRSLRWSYD